MAEQTFAIDFGNSNICIYQKGVGLVLKEPCLVATTKTQDGYTTKALGIEAKNLQGKTDSRTAIFSPICEGEIKSSEYAFLLAKHLLKKFTKKSHCFLRILNLLPASQLEYQIKKKKNIFLYVMNLEQKKLLPFQK